MSGRDSPDWARMGGFITEVDEERGPPRSTLTDDDRVCAAKLKLRNALQGGHADVALGFASVPHHEELHIEGVAKGCPSWRH